MVERVRRVRSLSLEPPLLITESAEEFENLCDRLEQEVKPSGIIEQIYVQDVANIVWEILRLRRCKAVLINTGFQRALRTLLENLLENTDCAEEVTDLAVDWFTKP